jgi:hypothetical protein
LVARKIWIWNLSEKFGIRIDDFYYEKRIWISCGTLLQSKWETQNHASTATLFEGGGGSVI